MARCPECKHRWREMDDECGMFECPKCGYHPYHEGEFQGRRYCEMCDAFTNRMECVCGMDTIAVEKKKRRVA